MGIEASFRIQSGTRDLTRRCPNLVKCPAWFKFEPFETLTINPQRDEAKAASAPSTKVTFHLEVWDTSSWNIWKYPQRNSNLWYPQSSVYFKDITGILFFEIFANYFQIIECVQSYKIFSCTESIKGKWTYLSSMQWNETISSGIRVVVSGEYPRCVHWSTLPPCMLI